MLNVVHACLLTCDCACSCHTHHCKVMHCAAAVRLPICISLQPAQASCVQSQVRHYTMILQAYTFYPMHLPKLCCSQAACKVAQYMSYSLLVLGYQLQLGSVESPLCVALCGTPGALAFQLQHATVIHLLCSATDPKMLDVQSNGTTNELDG